MVSPACGVLRTPLWLSFTDSDVLSTSEPFSLGVGDVSLGVAGSASASVSRAVTILKPVRHEISPPPPIAWSSSISIPLS